VTLEGEANYMEEKLSYMERRLGVTRDIRTKMDLALIPCQARQ